ncbi:MAG: hypothetical protein AVDCRST_MAG49-1669 [uncultured Thermomicrobiales bacterium]|uniref:Uncharacterized protein n=1 Tax=uncultured Thermomicrobiales bacterium TaxID=1645740 RepID=A0A6J4UG50_9BACT|nr:MAG: hypothetical protein AVDCRST_MAG49-1669 [uncultured Thermomicrobiales bacterium]
MPPNGGDLLAVVSGNLAPPSGETVAGAVASDPVHAEAVGGGTVVVTRPGKRRGSVPGVRTRNRPQRSAPPAST